MIAFLLAVLQDWQLVLLLTVSVVVGIVILGAVALRIDEWWEQRKFEKDLEREIARMDFEFCTRCGLPTDDGRCSRCEGREL